MGSLHRRLGHRPASVRTRASRRRVLGRRWAGGERGAALIEAAFVTPVLFLLVFGLMDGAWALFGDHVVRGSAGAGVRVVSALANERYTDYQAIQAINRNLSGLDSAEINYVVIYKATGFGDPPSASCQAGASSSGTRPCNVYTPTELGLPMSRFGCGPTSVDAAWCPTSRNASARSTTNPAGPDFIGVWISVDHDPVTRVIFSEGRVIKSQSVVKIEPRTSG